MCALKLNDPGLPAELWDALISDDKSDRPVEDEHHVTSAQAICMPESSFRAISRLSANFLTIAVQQASQVPRMHPGMLDEQSLV